MVFVYMWVAIIIIYITYDYDCNLQLEGVDKESGTKVFVVALCLEYWPCSI
jgi:hypothetical protein